MDLPSEHFAQNPLQVVPAPPEPRKKKRAWNVLNKAKQKGQITQSPCEVCGSPDSQAHHDDYEEKLMVRWLCQKHHSQLHALRRDLAGLFLKYDRQTVDSVLRDHRKGSSQRQLAAKYGMAKSYVWKLIHGKCRNINPNSCGHLQTPIS